MSAHCTWFADHVSSQAAAAQPAPAWSGIGPRLRALLASHSLNHYHGQWCGRSWHLNVDRFETVDMNVFHWSKNECVPLCVFGCLV